MLLIKNFVAQSQIHGLGLFADQDIPADTKIWEFYPGLDIKISQELFESLPIIAKDYLEIYTYRNRVTGDYVLSFDGDRYTNHSTNPNTINLNFGENEGVTIAKYDIRRGEEITANYFEFDNRNMDWFSKK